MRAARVGCALLSGPPGARAGGNTTSAEARGGFQRDGFAIETAIGAGSFFAAYVTNNLVYKGGFMGVAAENAITLRQSGFDFLVARQRPFVL